jgi:hypothetical protein
VQKSLSPHITCCCKYLIKQTTQRFIETEIINNDIDFKAKDNAMTTKKKCYRVIYEKNQTQHWVNQSSVFLVNAMMHKNAVFFWISKQP